MKINYKSIINDTIIIIFISFNCCVFDTYVILNNRLQHLIIYTKIAHQYFIIIILS